MTENIGADDPITLQEAVDLVFRGHIAVSTLKLEAERGRLAVFKIGRRHFTTLHHMREMVERCRIGPPGQRPAGATAGPSSTPEIALAALYLELDKHRGKKRARRSISDPAVRCRK